MAILKVFYSEFRFWPLYDRGRDMSINVTSFPGLTTVYGYLENNLEKSKEEDPF
jgi:hypothetical protein